MPDRSAPQFIHLLDRDADFQTRELAHLASENSTLVGRPGHPGEILRVARELRDLSPGSLIHAWGEKSLITAAIANSGPIVHTLPSPPRQRWNDRLLWISRRRRLHILCDAPIKRHMLCDRGIAADRCHVIPPASRSTPAPALREPLRLQLGISNENFAVLAPGESTRYSGHKLALWTLAILYELDPTWRLLLWACGPQAEELVRTAEHLQGPELLITAPDLDPADLLDAADAALDTAEPSAPALPLAMCRDACLPIVGSRADSPRVLAQKLLRLRKTPAPNGSPDPSLISAARFREELAGLYARVVQKT